MPLFFTTPVKTKQGRKNFFYREEKNKPEEVPYDTYHPG